MSGICKDTAYHGWMLSLGLAHASEAAAVAAADRVGRGTETGADQAAVDAIRTELNRLDIRGRVVIGEGERDEAPMLYIGESVGTGEGEEVDIALDPLEGTTLCAKAMPNALSVIAMGPRGSLLHAPDVCRNKIAVGPDIPAGTLDPDATPQKNRTPSPSLREALPARSQPASWNAPVISRKGPPRLRLPGSPPVTS